MQHALTLKVFTADDRDVYRDIARIPEIHRDGIKEGTMCRITYEQRSAFVAIRGMGERDDRAIKLDDLTRCKLGVSKNVEYCFVVEELSILAQFCATWHTSDPFNRMSMRLSLISFALGFIGLALGIVSLFK